MLHSGIDLHERTVVISTVDADGRQWCVSATEASRRDRHEVTTGTATSTPASSQHHHAAGAMPYRSAAPTLLRQNSRMALGGASRWLGDLREAEA